MSISKGLAALALIVMATSCAGRIIYYPQGCQDRLGSPYKIGECMACVQRPLPHEYRPDNPDGDRCFRR